MYKVLLLNSVFLLSVVTYPHNLDNIFNIDELNITAQYLKSKYLHHQPPKELTKEDFRKNTRPFLNCDCGVTNSRLGKVVNGTISAPHKYPWMVQIKVKNATKPYCGASLINNRYVLTAAHCVFRVDPEGLVLILGSHTTEATEKIVVERDIQKITIHPLFEEKRFNKDIALLEIDEIDIAWLYKDYIRPVCLPDPMRNYESEEAIVSGWGQLSYNGTKADELRRTKVEILTLGSCKNEFGFRNTDITNKMLCAAKPGKDACLGDSGGPLVTKTRGDRFEQVGIISWGVNCASPKYPGVYTKVDKFMDFIASNTENADWCRI